MRKGEETRQRIIAAAAPLFNKQGYEGCSMQDIMAATGLEKGGIYRHFGSKEEIAAEAFDYAWAVNSGLRFQGIEEIPDAIDRLKHHIAAFIHASPIPGGCPLLNTGVDADDGNPLLRDRAQRALREWQRRLRGILAEGIVAKTVDGRIDPEKVARRIISSLEGSLLVSRIERNDVAKREVMESLDQYLEGLRSAKPQPRGQRPR